MNDTTARHHFWNLPFWLKPEDKALGTLTAFIRDAEHEFLEIITALQAHIDLLHEQQENNHEFADRFAVLDRTVARLIADTVVLASVAACTDVPKAKVTVPLKMVLQQVIDEIGPVDGSARISLNDLSGNTTIIGNPALLKVMLTVMIRAILQKYRTRETVNVVESRNKKRLTLSFDIGLAVHEGTFTPWRLGELRSQPTNGEGISLAAVDAMARLQRGELHVRNLQDNQADYRLTFNS